MSQIDNRVRWTTADLDLFPDNGNCYKIIDEELLVTRAPDLKHQKVISNICGILNNWSEQADLGEAVPGAGVIFTDASNVIPDFDCLSIDNSNKSKVYRRENAALVLMATLLSGDVLTSPLLPGFSCLVDRVFR